MNRMTAIRDALNRLKRLMITGFTEMRPFVGLTLDTIDKTLTESLFLAKNGDNFYFIRCLRNSKWSTKQTTSKQIYRKESESSAPSSSHSLSEWNCRESGRCFWSTWRWNSWLENLLILRKKPRNSSLDLLHSQGRMRMIFFNRPTRIWHASEGCSFEEVS